MKKKLLTVLTTGLLMFGMSEMASADLITDTLEDIGPDGTAITSRVIGGITVTISNSGNIDMGARTYFDNSPRAFNGAGGSYNVPLSPGNVSGTRFISTSDSQPINFAQPIIFDFSDPVFGFGLTTLDLLEQNAGINSFVTLQARDLSGQIVATQTRIGPQGSSGIDLDWFVSSNTAEITQVSLLSNIAAGDGYGYGLDDLTLEPVPLPPSVLLFGTGIAGFVGIRMRKRERSI